MNAGHGSDGSGGGGGGSAVATGDGSPVAGGSVQRCLSGAGSVSARGARGVLGRQVSSGRTRSRQAAAMAAEVTAATERAQYVSISMHVAICCMWHVCMHVERADSSLSWLPPRLHGRHNCDKFEIRAALECHAVNVVPPVRSLLSASRDVSWVCGV